MLKIRNLCAGTLAPFDFDLAAGECVALRGPSGAGKSLLLRALADLDPHQGEVSLAGLARDAMAAPLWRRQVCYLAAEPGWWADIASTHFPDREATLTLMAELDLAPALLDAEIARLSTGERQRLSLIRGLLLRPKVYLLDEPTAGLDAAAMARVEKVLRDRLAGGAGILLVTHDQEQARRLSTRSLVIENGRIGEETERVIEAGP